MPGAGGEPMASQPQPPVLKPFGAGLPPPVPPRRDLSFNARKRLLAPLRPPLRPQGADTTLPGHTADARSSEPAGGSGPAMHWPTQSTKTPQLSRGVRLSPLEENSVVGNRSLASADKFATSSMAPAPTSAGKASPREHIRASAPHRPSVLVPMQGQQAMGESRPQQIAETPVSLARTASKVASPRRHEISANFWSDESSRHILLNCAVYTKASLMFIPGSVCCVVALTADSPSSAQTTQCRQLRSWLIFSASSSIFIGTATAVAWQKLRATRLERGVAAARRLREKGFGDSRLGRSKHNRKRNRQPLEQLSVILVIPPIVAFIGMQVKLFSSASQNCTHIYDVAVWYTVVIYFAIVYQCTCLQYLQYIAWKEVDRLLLEDEENPALAPDISVSVSSPRCP